MRAQNTQKEIQSLGTASVASTQSQQPARIGEGFGWTNRNALMVYTHDQQRRAVQFIKRIRSFNKREYAKEYLAAKFRNQDTSRIVERCSYMAAQGVRLQLADILGD